MKRKQLYITEDQQSIITKIAEKMGGRPEAEVIRLILDKGIDVIKKELEANNE